MGGHLLVALVVFALVPAASGLSSVSARTGTSIAAASSARGITVRKPGPEPAGSQFVNGPLYVAPSAPAATDVGVRSLRAAVPGTYSCEGYVEIDTPNPPSALMNDRYPWGNFAPVKVGDGAGNINWRLSPYQNPSWYMWLHSLRWLGRGITAGGDKGT
ncbi:MAG: hypothetical protein QOE58_2318 [Actinomycetota bacterium]|nr:hypothetical protein [Actinomycetota bacterium]